MRTEDLLAPKFTDEELTVLYWTQLSFGFFADFYINYVTKKQFPNERHRFGCRRRITQQHLDAVAAPASSIERQRVLRTPYRRQIVCDVWAPNKRQVNDWSFGDILP